MNYVDSFLALKCAGDVWNVVAPVIKAHKEISESWAAIRYIKKIVLKEPHKYYVLDLCAGNALTSVLSAFLLPVRGAIAIDKLPRKRRWHLANNFKYEIEDVYDLNPQDIDENTILVGVHACSNLSKQIVEMYLESNAKHLVLIPCCMGPHNLPEVVSDKMGKYFAWCLSLALQAGGTLHEDKHMISPMNGIIVAHKGE